MRFEDYCKEEFDKIAGKLDGNTKKVEKLMIFMAITQAEDANKNKYSSAIIAVICSITSSGIMVLVTNYLA